MMRQDFEADLEVDARGVIRVLLPFDATLIWGSRSRHYVKGTINGVEFAGSLGRRGGRWYFPVSKDLQMKAGASAGMSARITLEESTTPPTTLPDELVTALFSAPSARFFFDGLSSFYQRQYASYVSGAKKAETRQVRAVEILDLLHQGRKQR
jgi:bacteriocin resistance YdeI/OmpD-like protein/uncharacterized protein DUF1905